MPLIDLPCSEEDLSEPTLEARDDYIGIITSCKDTTGRVMGDENVYHLAVTYTLEAHPEVPDAEGRLMFVQLPIVAKNSGRFVRFCKLFGKRPSEFDTNEALGARHQLKITAAASKRNPDEVFNNVSSWRLPADEVQL